MTTDDDATARALIDGAFGNTENELPRAFEAMATFRMAVDSYGQSQTASAAGVLSERLERTDNPNAAVHDVCAAGAIAVATLLMGTTCSDCGAVFTAPEGVQIGDGADLPDQAAACLINIALSGELATLTEALQMAYERCTVDNLCAVVVSLVQIHVELKDSISELGHGPH